MHDKIKNTKIKPKTQQQNQKHDKKNTVKTKTQN